MISGNLVIATAVAYVILLFGLAYVSDKRARRGREGFFRSPLIYTLAISVYCTSWTFYGAVGSAARNGLEFLAIYLGPTLVFVGWWYGLRKLIHIGHAQRITSVADLISSRYGKSSRLAVLVTLIAVVGTTPYIALQLKAITASLRVMSGEAPNTGALPQSLDDVSLAFIIAAAMALFAVLFGTRNVNANEQHHGVVAAIAFEAVVKLAALLAVGFFVVFGLGGGLGATFARASNVGIDLYGEGAFSNRWIAINILSAAAIICLPRQFQITVVENADASHLRTASWAFPLYLLLMSLFTMPIAIMGLSLLPAGSDPDMFVLTLPLLHDQQLLAMFAFIGGFSSATSMIIIASIALSIMVSNHIIMPIALRAPGMLDQEDGSGVKKLLLSSRRISIAGVLFLGFAYFWLTSGSGALAPIGLISFTGVAQFLPAIVAALYWRDATRQGALAGLVIGFVVWAYTLFVPSFASTNISVADLVAMGPWGIDLLKPQALFGLSGLDPLVHSVFWSLTLNTVALVAVSIVTDHDPVGRLQATLFVDAFKHNSGGQPRYVRSSAALNDLYRVAQRVLGADRAQALFDAHAPRTEADELIEPTPHFIALLEKELAGSIGAASAHVMLSQVVSGDTESIEEVIRMADETQQILEYSQRLEHTTEELQSTAGQLRQANEQLRQLDQQKDEFLSQVSHEVRTPMTSIRSFSEILLTHADLPQARREQFLNTIHTESLRLTSLLDEILDLSALERGEKLWVNQPVDINEALKRAIDVCAPITEQNQLDVRVGDLASPVWVHGNADRITQVFINLISNAAKYNDAGNPHIEISAGRHESEITMDFADNGPGIPSKDRRTIFDKFSRGPRDQQRAQQGSGLGLSISRQILANMNGSLELVRNRKTGACFRVTVPLASVPVELEPGE